MEESPLAADLEEFEGVYKEWLGENSVISALKELPYRVFGRRPGYNQEEETQAVRSKPSPTTNPRLNHILYLLDEIAEVLSLLSALVCVLISEIGVGNIIGQHRIVSVLVYGLSVSLAVNILKRVPWNIICSGARRGVAYSRGTVRMAAYAAMSLDGVILSFSSIRRIIVAVLIAASLYGPDQIAGNAISTIRVASKGIGEPGELTLGPIGGGYREKRDNGRTVYHISTLSFLSRDIRDVDDTVFFKTKDDIMYLPRHPQEFYGVGDVVRAHVRSWPTIRATLYPNSSGISEYCKNEKNGAEQDKFKFGLKFRFDTGSLFITIAYDRNKEQFGNENINNVTMQLDWGSADVRFSDTESGAHIDSVNYFKTQREKKPMSSTDLLEVSEEMCKAYGNIVHYGLNRDKEDIQKWRIVAAAVIRTAWDFSSTGFEGDSEKVPGTIVTGHLGYFAPNWLFYTFITVTILALIIGISNLTWIDSPARGIGHILSLLGRDASKHSIRPYPTYMKAQQEIRDDNNDQPLFLGVATDPEGTDLRTEVLNRDNRRYEVTPVELNIASDVRPLKDGENLVREQR